MRTFGVEIEVVGLDRSDATYALRRAFREHGIDTRVEYEDSCYATHLNRWTVKPDGSLQANCSCDLDEDDCDCGAEDYACEVVSPILSGVDGLKQVKIVLEALKGAGGYINDTCGLHVHIGSEDLNSSEIEMVLRRYVKFYNKISARFPHARLYNNYCKELTGAGIFASVNWNIPTSVGTQITNDVIAFNLKMRERQDVSRPPELLHLALSDLLALQHDRYVQVNLCSWNKYKTIEFRQHHGSLDSTEVVRWIQFLIGFVGRSAELTRQMLRADLTRAALHDLGFPDDQVRDVNVDDDSFYQW